MSVTPEGRSRGREDAVWRFLRGPRFVDLPIRIFALVMGLTVFVPGAFEIVEPLYIGLLVIAYLLIIVSPFAPLTVTVVSVLFSLIFLSLYPELENMFPEALILAAAVLLSQFRWWACTVGVAGLFAYLFAATWSGGVDEGLPGVIDLGYGLTTSSLLGLAAGFIERRIRREIASREEAAKDHARAVQMMRMRFTGDMHDTISHSLYTESAIIRTLGRSPHGPDSERMIAELALVNAEAARRLRQLIARLRSNRADTSSIELQGEANLLMAAIEDGCAAGGVHLSTQVDTLPAHVAYAVGEHFTAFILELATNVIRHAKPGTQSQLEVRWEQTAPGVGVMRYTSSNEAERTLSAAPRSLRERAAAVGGRCRVDAHDDGRVVVEVTHPLQLLDPASGSRNAVCVKDDFAIRLAAGGLGPEDDHRVTGPVKPGTDRAEEAGAQSGASEEGAAVRVHPRSRLEGRRA